MESFLKILLIFHDLNNFSVLIPRLTKKHYLEKIKSKALDFFLITPHPTDCEVMKKIFVEFECFYNSQETCDIQLFESFLLKFFRVLYCLHEYSSYCT